jgi:hypothetical protein
MPTIISREHRHHTATPDPQRTELPARIARLATLAPDQIEAGLTWLATRRPDIFDAVIQAARTWDDGHLPPPAPTVV